MGDNVLAISGDYKNRRGAGQGGGTGGQGRGMGKGAGYSDHLTARGVTHRGCRPPRG